MSPDGHGPQLGGHSCSDLRSPGGLWNPPESHARMFGYRFFSPRPSSQLEPWAGATWGSGTEGGARTPPPHATAPRIGRTLTSEETGPAAGAPNRSWELALSPSPACSCETGSWPSCLPRLIPGPSNAVGPGWALTPTPGPQGDGPSVEGGGSVVQGAGELALRPCWWRRSGAAAAWPSPAPPRPACAPER